MIFYRIEALPILSKSERALLRPFNSLLQTPYFRPSKLQTAKCKLRTAIRAALALHFYKALAASSEARNSRIGFENMVGLQKEKKKDLIKIKYKTRLKKYSAVKLSSKEPSRKENPLLNPK